MCLPFCTPLLQLPLASVCFLFRVGSKKGFGFCVAGGGGESEGERMGGEVTYVIGEETATVFGVDGGGDDTDELDDESEVVVTLVVVETEPEGVVAVVEVIVVDEARDVVVVVVGAEDEVRDGDIIIGVMGVVGVTVGGVSTEEKEADTFKDVRGVGKKMPAGATAGIFSFSVFFSGAGGGAVPFAKSAFHSPFKNSAVGI